MLLGKLMDIYKDVLYLQRIIFNIINIQQNKENNL